MADEKGQYDQVISDHSKALETNPNDANAYFSRGLAYGNKGEYDRAISDYTKAIEIDPHAALAYFNRGRLYHNSKAEYDLAISDFTKVLEIRPDFAEAYRYRGYAYNIEGQYDKAISDFTKVIEFVGTDPKQFMADLNGELAYDVKDIADEHPQAVQTISNVIKAFASKNRGFAYASKGDYDLAIADFTASIEIAPKYAEAYFLRGSAYGDKGNRDLAIADYTRAIDIDPNLNQAYNNRAILYYEKGDYDNAWADVHKAESLGKQVSPEFLKKLREVSQTEEPNETTLAGLQGVNVVVESMSPEVEKYGLTQQAFQTDVELRLRQYGVKVLSREDWGQTPGCPYLYVNVSPLINEKSGYVAASINVELRQLTSLRRNPTKVVFAGTWTTGSVCLYGLGRLKELGEDVRDHVDEFINAYRAANPAKSPPVPPPVTKDTRVSSPATEQPQKGLVSRILSSEDGFSATIGTTTVREGDTIDGVTVVEIRKDKVVFEREGKWATLRWSQEVGEAPHSQWQ